MDRMRELALDIYDTVVDQSKLPGALQRFAEAIDARGCIVFEMPDRSVGPTLTVSAHSEGYEPAVINNYISHFAVQELADQAPFEACSLSSDKIELVDESIMGKTKAELRAQPNVRWMRALGIKHRAGGLLDRDNKNLSRFSVQFSTDANPPWSRLLAKA
jgi:hypothetical protein